jgi:HEAT repeat protein
MDQEQIQSLINRMCNGEQVQAQEIGYLKNDAGKPDVQAALLHVLQNDEWSVRRKAAEVLAPHVESGACNGESTPVKTALLNVLQNDEGYVRYIAAGALRNHANEPEVKTALLNVLQNDEEAGVRNTAAGALRNHVNEPEVKAALLYVLQNDTDWYVRRTAAEVLAPHVESGACNGESTPVKDALLNVLQNDEGYVRCIAAEALAPHVESGVCNGESTPVKDALLNVLQNDTARAWYVRCTAAEVLAPHVDVPPVEEAFCAILNDHDNPPELLKVVADGLKRCPDKPAVQAAFRGVLEEQEWLNKFKAKKKLTRVSAVCKTAVAVLADHAWGVEAVPGLLCNTMQTHRHPPVRLATARALAPHVRDNPTVKAAFCDVLENGEFKEVRYKAYKVLQPYKREARVQNACFAALERELRPQR